jgi:hypothetical protein
MRLGWALHKARADSPTRPIVLRIASTILVVVGAILLISGLVIQITRSAR